MKIRKVWQFIQDHIIYKQIQVYLTQNCMMILLKILPF